MRRVLFVDDDPAILEGLRNVLRKQRRRWDMVFVEGGEAALSALRSAPFDVVVTDMRMPGMDGAMLLAKVKEEFPRVVRLVLSGHAERESFVRGLAVAHQFIGKPCDADVLPNVIERACELQARLAQPELVRLMEAAGPLLAAPPLYLRMTLAMAREEVPVDSLTADLEAEPAVAAKLVELANRGVLETGTVTAAAPLLTGLGLESTRSLLLLAHLLVALERVPLAATLMPAAPLALAAIRTARLARRIVRAGDLAAYAFTAGLLHLSGRIVLAVAMPERLAAVAAAVAAGRSLGEAEQQVLGFGHGDVGAYLLHAWGLHHPVVEAVACYQTPSRVPQRQLEVVGAVHLACALLGRLEALPAVAAAPALDTGYVDALGLTQDLPRWQAMAAEDAGG